MRLVVDNQDLRLFYQKPIFWSIGHLGHWRWKRDSNNETFSDRQYDCPTVYLSYGKPICNAHSFNCLEVMTNISWNQHMEVIIMSYNNCGLIAGLKCYQIAGDSQEVLKLEILKPGRASSLSLLLRFYQVISNGNFKVLRVSATLLSNNNLK